MLVCEYEGMIDLVDEITGSIKYAVIIDHKYSKVFVVRYSRIYQLIKNLFNLKDRFTILRILNTEPDKEQIASITKELF